MERWTEGMRRVGIVSAIGILVIGVLYLAVISLWLVVVRTPREPIGDPYLAAMELLTIVSAVALVGFLVALWCFVVPSRRVPVLAALMTGTLGACLTMAVHFVQLTAIRQLWRTGQLPDYRLVWPSAIFAVEYFAWDVLVGLSMVFAGMSLGADPHSRHARQALLIGGVLCLVGAAGPLAGRMLLQNVAVVGYATVLPVAGALMARVFLVKRSVG